VSKAVDLARERQNTQIDVSFHPANLLSRPFWFGIGFTPIGWKVARRLPDSLLLRPQRLAPSTD
jgi:hypothetical protein